ncbi:MAG TPA: 50S ribosomal protein L23 [Anaerolineae bacterium]|jgi:large subunit ribosomal protein L23|nr:50S ribosomal protein L23 [Anaerolineae bacterium]
MKDPRDVIIRPVVSEKSYAQIEHNKYTFEVAKDARKEEIGQAIEEIFKVHVTSVNTITMRGRRKRQGWTSGRTRDWKKAIVTLREGDRIEVFEAR